MNYLLDPQLIAAACMLSFMLLALLIMVAVYLMKPKSDWRDCTPPCPGMYIYGEDDNIHTMTKI